MVKKYTHFRFFDLKEIIFDNSESVTLIEKGYFDEKEKYINLLTDFKMLNKIPAPRPVPSQDENGL